MPILFVDNGFSTELSGLAKIQKFSKLSQKRITRKIREVLWKEYGEENSKVTCDATYSNGIWKGKCKIYGTEYNFEIYE